MCSKILLIQIVGIYVVFLLGNICGNKIVAGTTCIGPDLAEGICLPLSKCSIIQNELDLAGTENAILNEYIQDSNAICNYINSYICCPIEFTYEHGTTVHTLMPEIEVNKKDTIHPPNIPTSFNDLYSSQPRLLTPEEGCGYTKVPQNRIVGGGEARIGAWPWMVLTALTKGDLYAWWCGGTLITTKHILTAAHCIREDLSFVRLGEIDYKNSNPAAVQNIPVSKAVSHEKYTPSDGRNDIAILSLKYAATFSDTVRPICLPFNGAGHFTNFVGLNVISIGWGLTAENGTRSSVLREVQIPVVDLSICKHNFNNPVDDSIICAGGEKGKGTCDGDSGGPITSGKIINGTEYIYQIGIAAYKFVCGAEGYPLVYMNVQSFIGWIQNHIEE